MVALAKQKAFDVNREARFSSGQLRQLANTQAEYDALRAKQKELFTSGATRTLGAAGQVVFDITSAGLMNDASFQLLKELGRTGTIEDLSTFSQSITRVSSAFGAKETGDTKAIISKAFAASEFSSANVPQLLSAAATVGPVANMPGLTDEETMSAVTALSKTSNAEEAATALRSLLFSTAEKEGFEGLSIVERVQKLKGMDLSTGAMREYLGRKEAIRAYSDLLNTAAVFQQAYAAVVKANQDTAAVDRKLAFKLLVRNMRARCAHVVKSFRLWIDPMIRISSPKRRPVSMRPKPGWRSTSRPRAPCDNISKRPETGSARPRLPNRRG